MARRRIVRLVAFLLVGLAAAGLWMNRSEPGPLQFSTAAVNATETAVPALAGQWVAFGGYSLESRRPVGVTVLSVNPAAVPDGVRWQAGLHLVLPGASAVGALRSRVPLVALPHSIPAEQVLNPWPWQVVLNLKAERPGTYTVPGLNLTYLAHGQRYTVFFPDRFVLCAGRRTWPPHCP
jgi:hypothetical protein